MDVTFTGIYNFQVTSINMKT